MAANPTPTSNPVLLALCDRLVAGLQALEVEIGIKQNTEAALRADIDLVRAAVLTLGQAKMALREAQQDYHQADQAGARVISDCRLRLARVFGSKFSSQWAAAGFRGRSSAVPEMAAKRFTLLESLALYFTANPAHESIDMGATAAICHALHETLSDARSAVNHAKSIQATAVKALAAAFKQLRSRVRGLLRELWIVLPETDARWLRFGLNMPARLPMPDKVSEVTLEVQSDGSVQIDWPPAAHAHRYRLQMRRPVTETKFTNLKTQPGTSHLLRKQLPGETLEIRVIAANKTGEAAPSPVARVVCPP
ncbi:MAG: fibronectin type III domain-containing protein [Verrucomicrobiaceae bacterium]|nr:fibronectin type III domain-containing protein [Verrucomicrobiaceae bacterium]